MNKIKNIEGIQICKKCLYPSTHPLGITFDKNWICSGCKIHEEKNSLNWNFRLNKLKKIVSKYKSKKGNYDCIVPVSGGGDSHFIVHTVKNILKLSPLLVCHNKYYNTPIGIKNIANLRIKFDCDILIQNINLNVVKKLTKYTLMEHGNIYWPVISGSTSFPVNIAAKYKIPLIIWGAHQGMEQTGMFSHEHEVEMTRRYREDHDLYGKDEDSLISLDNDFQNEDLDQLRYPDMSQINSIGIRGIYLGNFIRWDSVAQHKLMTKMYKFKSSILSRTFDTYDHVDCFNYINIHDYLKLSKHGYSKVLDHACREIRYKRISRENALYLVEKYQLKKIENVDLFCEWLDISKKSLNFVINRFKKDVFWKETDIDNWTFNGVSQILKKKGLKKKKIKIKNFFDNSSLKENLKKYIFFGKGI